MAARKVPSKLYIPPEDRKYRYETLAGRLDAFLKSVEWSRKVTIVVNALDKEIFEFAITVEVGQDGDNPEEDTGRAKQDILEEVCSVEGIKKHDQFLKYEPSRKVSKVMSVEDQARLQKSGTSLQALTIATLEEQEATTGPNELRQFACDECEKSWWRTVLTTKPVSRCEGDKCGHQRYDALPRFMEFGIGRCVCPNDDCDDIVEFFVRCETKATYKCRKCKTVCKPYVHPAWKMKKKKRKRKNKNKSQDAAFFHGTPAGDLNSGLSPTMPPPVTHCPPGAALNMQMQAQFPNLVVTDNTTPIAPEAAPRPPMVAPRRRKNRRKKKVIFNASEIHVSTGGTVSTFLSQVDFDMIAEEVDLDESDFSSDYGSDFNSDDDEERVGACKFECECGNEYTVKCRKKDTAPCECGRINSPSRWAPPRDIQKRSANTHNCSRCNGSGDCPNLEKSSFPQWEGASD